MPDENDSDDLLLGRLHQAASGDAAVRQLRRRYDALRRDYEELLDRLGELEDRLDEPVVPSPAPTETPAGPPAAGTSIANALAGPLLKLRDDYLEAVASIQAIVAGLDGVAAGALKGQHTATAGDEGRSAEGTPTGLSAQGPAAAKSGNRPAKVHVEVRGGGFGELLDFQERLSEVEGVARVSISAIDNERATLVVELTAAG